MRTLKYLQKVFEQCLIEAKALAIPVQQIDGIRWGNLDKKWGICIWHTKTNTFDIVISTRCQRKIISKEDLKNIVFHEILHTCEGCIEHSKLWVQYALKIDNEYGYGVSIFKTSYEFLHHELPVLHRMVCKNCSGICEIRDPADWERFQNGVKFHCSWCGENFKK